MSDNRQNQEQPETKEELHLYQIQPELIQAKATLEKVLRKLCQDDALAEQIRKGAGDSVTTSIWYLQQVIKYLTTIIDNNQLLIKALAGELF